MDTHRVFISLKIKRQDTQHCAESISNISLYANDENDQPIVYLKIESDDSGYFFYFSRIYDYEKNHWGSFIFGVDKFSMYLNQIILKIKDSKSSGKFCGVYSHIPKNKFSSKLIRDFVANETAPQFELIRELADISEDPLDLADFYKQISVHREPWRYPITFSEMLLKLAIYREKNGVLAAPLLASKIQNEFNIVGSQDLQLFAFIDKDSAISEKGRYSIAIFSNTYQKMLI